jgi:hypothetical protein
MNAGIIPWLIAGGAFFALLLAVTWQFRNRSSFAQLASAAVRVELVNRMQLDLVTAAEAEKSSVLAITDEESRRHADEVRAATADVERARQNIGTLLGSNGLQRERDALAQFARAFGNLQDIDKEVLGLAVQNTNIKAYGLLFGPAADTLADMDAALYRIENKFGDSAEAKTLLLLSSGARIGILRIQALLAPHIAERSDEKMDQMEVSMVREDTQIRADFRGLAALTKLAGDVDLTTASARYDHYVEIKEQILRLSRENTNVRSLELSLNEKRNAMILCLDALSALKQAILDEPIVGVTYGRPQHPR